MIDARDQELLHDWIDGRLGEAEAEALARRVMTDPELAREHAELTKLVSQLATLREERAPVGFADAVARATVGGKPHGPRRPLGWLGTIASLAAALTIAVVFWRVSDAQRFDAVAPVSDKAFAEREPGRRVLDRAAHSREAEPRAASAAKPSAPAPAPASGDRPDADTNEMKQLGYAQADSELSGAIAPSATDQAEASGEPIEAKREGSKSDSPQGEGWTAQPAGAQSVTTVVWRVRKAPPAVGLASSRVARDESAPLAESDARRDGKPGVALPPGVRAAIESIREQAPQRIVEIDMDDTARAAFLASAVESGWVVDEFSAEVRDDATEESSDRLAAKARAAEAKDAFASVTSQLENAGRWNRVSSSPPGLDGRSDRRGSTPLGKAPGPATAGSAPGASAGGPETKKAALPEAAGNDSREKGAELGRSIVRVVVVYEFDPPR